jgi:selenium metabolism protein YedF
LSTTIVINSEVLGKGSDELGGKLMGSLLRKLCANKNKPDVVVFYNSGVKLLARGSSVLDALDALAEAGVDLVACGTCVAFYEIGQRIAAGRVGDMQEIVSTLMNSEKVITV